MWNLLKQHQGDMIDKKKFCCILVLLLCQHDGGNSQQTVQFNPYANSRSLPQLEQQPSHLYDTTGSSNNLYVPHSHSQSPYSNMQEAAFAPRSYVYEANANPNQQQHFYHYATPSSGATASQTQLWSRPPIVVQDDDVKYPTPVTNNDDRHANSLSDTTRRNYELSSTPHYEYTNNNNRRGYQEPLPSHFNYPNSQVYHSSDVWRQQQHQINNASPVLKEDSLTNLRRSQYPERETTPTSPSPFRQSPTPTLYAANTDLNYLQAIPINHKPYYSAAPDDGRDNSVDYAEHFKEYLRKHPRRIEPIY